MLTTVTLWQAEQGFDANCCDNVCEKVGGTLW